VLELRVYGPAERLAALGSELQARGSARHAALARAVDDGNAVLIAEVEAGFADAALELAVRHGVAQDDVALARFDDVGMIDARRREATLIWADVIGQARQNARPVARYLAFMVVAGVIAAFGVIQANSTLIVGAMAVSPDTLPVTAICAALLARRWPLAGRAGMTLAVGLGATCATAAAVTVFLHVTGDLPAGFEVGESALAGLTTINSATIGVALAAGVAAMLALETRASAAVGVAISVTTIPAAAYLGVAAGLGQLDKVWGALAVLAVNVAMLLLGGTTTLFVQRAVAARSAP
jgi:uncharacterized hydrophobic protein (TIGR00271 family)